MDTGAVTSRTLTAPAKQSNYTKCVSEILEHRLTIIKEYSVAYLGVDL